MSALLPPERMERIKRLVATFGIVALASLGSIAHASPILYISDASGNIGQVDVATQSVVAGSVHATGQSLTDIGFNSAGTLYGTTFTNLYTINSATGAASGIGAYSSGGAMNALIGNGLNLLGAAFSTNVVYAINAATAATSTFAVLTVPSAGDLAFSGSALYESAISNSGDNELVDVSTGTIVGLFRASSAMGPTFDDVFGLASAGGATYAVAGTEVYSVDLSSAILTPLFDYSHAENGQSLTAATGTAVLGEAPGGTPTPEPASVLLIGSALAGLGVLRKRK